METVSLNPHANLPAHVLAIVNDDWQATRDAGLSLPVQQKVAQMCAISAASCSAEWVELVKSWGMDLNAPFVEAGGQRSFPWLWYAFARGKTKQVLALIKNGACSMELDTEGNSGLGLFVRDNVPFSVERLFPIMKALSEHGLPWRTWPDAERMDAWVIKATGGSLGSLLSNHEALCLTRSTSQVAPDPLPVRL